MRIKGYLINAAPFSGFSPKALARTTSLQSNPPSSGGSIELKALGAGGGEVPDKGPAYFRSGCDRCEHQA
jgi:hypothetical protein